MGRAVPLAIVTSKLEQLFMNSTSTDDRKIVRLAMLYFLEVVLLGKDPKTKVQAEHVRHMYNFKDFNSYSWGRVCFMKALESLKKSLVDRVGIHKKKITKDPKHKNEAYTLAGFSMAFQDGVSSASLGKHNFDIHYNNRLDKLEVDVQKIPTIETTPIPTPYRKGDDLIIIPSTQTLSVQQVTNSTLKVYVRKKRVRKESIYLRSPYIDPIKKSRMLVAFKVKPSIELNDTLALKRWMAQVDIIEPNFVKWPVGDGDRSFFRDLCNSGEWLSNLDSRPSCSTFESTDPWPIHWICNAPQQIIRLKLLTQSPVKSFIKQKQSWMPTMEETILVGDDLMMGPPSPLIPSEIASHVLEGVDLCDGILRNLFLCLQVNDIEPFCQEEIALYRECSEKRDKELRQRLQDSERKLGLSMPLDQAKERATQLESEVTSLERRLILASGIEGIEGFRQRWTLHGRLTDIK
ncbi:hypothetical protein KPL71_024534 [Citrus sinensis]|uniref:Uncharacterized protein n=1 Tax=Citrus sinensis TaxID=2711 RepID=A0ACB8IS12_CITSI|nr:hypothetical protein KPL71_024534 [Citrus sinensis]